MRHVSENKDNEPKRMLVDLSDCTYKNCKLCNGEKSFSGSSVKELFDSDLSHQNITSSTMGFELVKAILRTYSSSRLGVETNVSSSRCSMRLSERSLVKLIYAYT